MTAPKAKRRWFPYRLPALLVVVALLASAYSWLALKMQETKRQRETAEVIRKLGGIAGWSQPSGPAWLWTLLGDDFFEHIEGVTLEGTQVTDAGLGILKDLNQLVDLGLGNTKITDVGLEKLKGLNQLEVFDLSTTKITDAGLENLKGMNKLLELNLWGSNVTDAGLEHLQGLSQLEELNLADTQVTDAGLEHLKGLNQLAQLDVSQTKVTRTGAKNFEQALPNRPTVIRHRFGY